jgi:hypothetical protein
VPFVLAFYHQNANAKSEFATLRKNMVAVQPFLRAIWDPRGTLGAFSWFILCRVAKNEHKPSANAHEVQGERP